MDDLVFNGKEYRPVVGQFILRHELAKKHSKSFTDAAIKTLDTIRKRALTDALRQGKLEFNVVHWYYPVYGFPVEPTDTEDKEFLIIILPHENICCLVAEKET